MDEFVMSLYYVVTTCHVIVHVQSMHNLCHAGLTYIAHIWHTHLLHNPCSENTQLAHNSRRAPLVHIVCIMTRLIAFYKKSFYLSFLLTYSIVQKSRSCSGVYFQFMKSFQGPVCLPFIRPSSWWVKTRARLKITFKGHGLCGTL